LTQNDSSDRVLPSTIKERLAELTPNEMKYLEAVHFDYSRKQWLRSMGTINIFLGGLTLALGLSIISHSWLAPIQVLFGGLTILQSIWAIFVPTTGAILRFVGILLFSSIWNLLLSIGNGANVFAGVIGVLQIWWTWQAFKLYRLNQKTNVEALQLEAVQLYNQARRMISSATFHDDPAGIKLWIGRSLWHGLLLEDKAALASSDSKLLFICDKDDLSFATGMQSTTRKRIYGRVISAAESSRAMMTRDSYDKYAKWKGDRADEVTLSPTAQYLSWSAKKIILLVIGLLLCLLASVVIMTLTAPMIFNDWLP
jgi:hypothetical protein